IDLDRFKALNDALGHRTGDEVLTKMAERLHHHVRSPDTLARLGGDEFVVVAEEVADEQAAVELGNRLVQAGRAPLRVGDEDFSCTLSVGVAATADPGRDPSDLLQEADLALYRAKGRGRDRAEVFDERLRTSAVDRLTTERMLRRALDEHRLVIEYQPIIDLRSRLAVGAEALVRIRNGDSALLQPESFIDVAKETGLLAIIDDRVLDDALRQATRWHGSTAQVESPAVSVNVTARHLADARFTDTVIDLLDASGLPPRCLQIEVTERILMETSNSAMKSLRALRRAGVQVGLDDFGTGYSSLAHLRQFPLDFVKIDRSCITELDSGGSERSVVAAIIWLCHALDLVVIAEGVETPSQLEALEGLGCDRAQGFVFGPAGDPSLLSAFVYRAG
ncbi:MAG: putative bifunctional diguanylate cyclase/phosphodiesterase, partial [Acidimicrobiales bacterium]